MSIFLLGLVSLIFGIGSLIYELNDINQRRSIRLINVFGLMYCLSYGFLTSIIMFAYEFANIEFRRIVYTSSMMNSLWLWLLLAIIGYLVIRTVYSLKPVNLIASHGKCGVRNNQRDYKRLLITSFVCLAIGLVSLFLWSNAYGGVFELIKVANTVRSGHSDINNSMAFFKHPARIVTIVSYISVLLIQNKYKTRLNCLLFVISFISSILFMLASDGRLSMAMYFAVLLLIGGKVFKKTAIQGKKILFLCVIALLALLLIIEMDSITHFIRTGEILQEEKATRANGILNEFAFVIVAGQNASNLWLTEGSHFLIFQDLLSGIFAWIPTSLKPGDFINIWEYNTQLCHMSNLYSGQWPTDFISTSIYTLGIGGVFVFSTFWGMIIKKIDWEYSENHSIFYDVVYYSLSMSFLRLVDYCMLYDFILGIFYIFVAFIIWKLSSLFVPQRQVCDNMVTSGENK